MLKEYCGGRQVYLVTGYTDMRKAIDGLAVIEEGVLGENPCGGGLYLFCEWIFCIQNDTMDV